MPIAAVKPRFALYFALNLLFLLVLAITYAIGGSANPRIIFLMLLFALCSSSVIDLDGLNGRYSLLGLFMLAYFLYFGVGDLLNMSTGIASELSGSTLSPTETVILVGGALLVIGYRITISIVSAERVNSPARDWYLRTLLLVGLALWAIGTYATFVWYVHIVTDFTNEATRAGLSKVSPIAATAFILAQMMQPLGVLIIAYTWRLTRSRALLVLLLGIILLQMLLGFVVDIKGLAMMGLVLVIVTCVLVDGRVPKTWLAGAVLFVIVVFPVLQAYRVEIHGTRGVARTEVIENFWKTLKLAVAATEKVNTGTHRAQTFLERLSLKWSVQMIVDKTGSQVPYQHGYTLTPILSTFVPKIIWSDKPDIPTGQIVNRVFNVTDQEETYISPTHLGELYWNFGWPGVVVGMMLIGSLCGFVGGYNLGEARTITRLLVTVLTIQQVIHGFEGSLASSYVVYFRSLAAVGLLHLVFARVSVTARSKSGANSEANILPVNRAGEIKSFPNLLT